MAEQVVAENQQDRRRPPPPSTKQLETCKRKNESLASKRRPEEKDSTELEEESVAQCGNSWKETVEILQQRLNLAYRMKQTALQDAKSLKEKIKKQDEKLLQLQASREKLAMLEQRYKSITSENSHLRAEIIKKSNMLNDAMSS